MSSPTAGALERVIRRDQLLVGFGLAATTVLAWVYLVRAARGMGDMAAEAQMHAAMGMADPRVWGIADWVGLFVMWAVMMAAMMLPSASPLILLVLGVYRRRGDRQARAAAVSFVAGYLVTWTAFSAVASAAQFGLHRTAVLPADMRLSSTLLSGVLLACAGVYQWLPIKSTCLTHCQSPFGFLTRHWREGIAGGFGMGLRHGMFCVGCCWLLMVLLFVLGVMNLLWVAAISAFVLLEKLGPGGTVAGRVGGAAVAAWGVYLIVTALPI